MSKVRLRLKAIKFGVDFRKSEMTNFDLFRKSRGFPGHLTVNEAFLFVSKGGNQLVWILNVGSVKADNPDIRGRTHRRVVDSRRWRIDGSTGWNPDMLQNYANEVGVELVGFRRFEEEYDDQRAA